MRPFGLGLLAALMVALAAPAAALAAPAAPKAPAVDANARKKGMADAPALVQSAGINCQVSDARLAGTAPADKKTGAPGASVYEVACGPGQVGFLVQTNGTAAPNVFSCIVANYPADQKPPTSPCILP